MYLSSSYRLERAENTIEILESYLSSLLEQTVEDGDLIKAIQVELKCARDEVIFYKRSFSNTERFKKQQELIQAGTQCTCNKCIEKDDLLNSQGLSLRNSPRYYGCPECGNKRCPRKHDHTQKCTRSNLINQKGSAYEFSSFWCPNCVKIAGRAMYDEETKFFVCDQEPCQFKISLQDRQDAVEQTIRDATPDV